MPIVNFLQYRQHDEARTHANNAIMALLAGSHLASHTLQLTVGSESLLPQIFPQVPHIRRFNLETSTARTLLVDAELHLGAMAVPYVLAIHEDFGNTCLKLLGERARKAATLHDALSQRISGINWGPHQGAFQIARVLRNSLIHTGGRVEQQAIREFGDFVDTAGRAEWIRLAGRDPLTLQVGDRVTFAHGEVVATLSATHNLAKTINFGLQSALPRATWARIVIEDIEISEPGHLRHHQRLRKCVGYARYLYGPLALTDAEIQQALTNCGY